MQRQVRAKTRLAVGHGAVLAVVSLLFVYVTLLTTMRTGISCVPRYQHIADGDTLTSVSLFDYWNTVLYVAMVIPITGMALFVNGTQRSALVVCLFFSAMCFVRYISVALLSNATATTVFVVPPNTTGSLVRGVVTVAFARVLLDLLESSRWYDIAATDPLRHSGWYRPLWVDHALVPLLRVAAALVIIVLAYRETPFTMACTTFAGQDAPSSLSIVYAMSVWAVSFALVFAIVRWVTFLRRPVRGWRLCWPLCDVSHDALMGPHYESATHSDSDAPEPARGVHVVRISSIHTMGDTAINTAESARSLRRRRGASSFARFQSSGGVAHTILLLGLLLSTADNALTSLAVIVVAMLWALHVRVFPFTCFCCCAARVRNANRAREERSAVDPSQDTYARNELLGTVNTAFMGEDTGEESGDGGALATERSYSSDEALRA